MSDLDVAAALERIAKAAAIPISARWLTAEDVGAMLGYNTAQVRERISVLPGFPVPLRINGGHPRWKATEIQEWAEAERAKSQSRRAAISEADASRCHPRAQVV